QRGRRDRVVAAGGAQVGAPIRIPAPRTPALAGVVLSAAASPVPSLSRHGSAIVWSGQGRTREPRNAKWAPRQPGGEPAARGDAPPHQCAGTAAARHLLERGDAWAATAPRHY